MNNIDEKARILASLTEEDWKVILSLSGENITLNVSQVTEKKLQNDTENVEDLPVRIRRVLKEIGVPPNILGYKYLQEAIILVCEDEDSISQMTTKIYPTVAKRYSTTRHGVERCIRHAVELAFNNCCNKELLAEIFGKNMSNQSKPANSVFIAAMAEYFTM